MRCRASRDGFRIPKHIKTGISGVTLRKTTTKLGLERRTQQNSKETWQMEPGDLLGPHTKVRNRLLRISYC